MKKQRRSAVATAQLIAINAKLYEEERSRQITRYRFTVNTLRRLAERQALRESFLKELEDELAELNWVFLRLGAEFAVVSLERSDSWVKLGSKRMADSAEGYLDMTDAAIANAFNERFSDDVEDEEDSSEE